MTKSKHPFMQDCFCDLRAKGHENLWDLSKSAFYGILDLKDHLETDSYHKHTTKSLMQSWLWNLGS